MRLPQQIFSFASLILFSSSSIAVIIQHLGYSWSFDIKLCEQGIALIMFDLSLSLPFHMCLCNLYLSPKHLQSSDRF